MRLLALLIVLMFCISVLLTGCDQGMEQPIRQVITPTKSPSEKAQAAMENVNNRRVEAQQMAAEADDFSTIFTASETIFKEELGFRKGLWVDLVEIYRQESLANTELLEGLENLQDTFSEKLEEGTLGMFYLAYISAFDGLIIEYLRLSFEFPEKNEAELFMLFRQSVAAQKVVIRFP